MDCLPVSIGIAGVPQHIAWLAKVEYRLAICTAILQRLFYGAPAIRAYKLMPAKPATIPREDKPENQWQGDYGSPNDVAHLPPGKQKMRKDYHGNWRDHYSEPLYEGDALKVVRSLYSGHFFQGFLPTVVGFEGYGSAPSNWDRNYVHGDWCDESTVSNNPAAVYQLSSS